MSKRIVYDLKSQTTVVKEFENKENELRPELEIKILKHKLFDSDYKAIKYAEGQISEEEYAPIKEQRQAWRDRINELESGLEV